MGKWGNEFQDQPQDICMERSEGALRAKVYKTVVPVVHLPIIWIEPILFSSCHYMFSSHQQSVLNPGIGRLKLNFT